MSEWPPSLPGPLLALVQSAIRFAGTLLAAVGHSGPGRGRVVALRARLARLAELLAVLERIGRS